MSVPTTYDADVQTNDGLFRVRYSAQGLCRLEFPSTSSRSQSLLLTSLPEPLRAWHTLTIDALQHALRGEPPEKLPPLDLSAGTTFQQEVWRELLRIETGRTRSYGEIAHSLGNPKAVRAVGGACGANPIPVLVPCHRVLAANHKIGGFSSGLDWKRKLLARENSLPELEQGDLLNARAASPSSHDPGWSASATRRSGQTAP